MKLQIASILVAAAALIGGGEACAAKPADQLIALQFIHPEVACLQCEAFRVGDVLNATDCARYANTSGVQGASCGINAAVFSLTAKLCATGTLTCVPRVFGEQARWAVGIDGDDQWTFVSDPDIISSVLSIQCSNSTTWQVPEDKRTEAHKDFTLPEPYAHGNFTLYCVSYPKPGAATTTETATTTTTTSPTTTTTTAPTTVPTTTTEAATTVAETETAVAQTETTVAVAGTTVAETDSTTVESNEVATEVATEASTEAVAETTAEADTEASAKTTTNANAV